MTSTKALLSKERMKKCGGYALIIQVIHQRKKKVMYLGYDLQAANFDSKKELAVYTKNQPLSRKQVKEINDVIVKTKSDIGLKLEHLKESGTPFTAADLILRYQTDQNDIYLFTYLQKQIDEKRKMNRMGIADAYQSTLNSLKRFMPDKEITFEEITLKFLRDYDNYLVSTKLVRNTINYYMRNLRTVYNRAFDDRLVSHVHNSFCKYHLYQVATVKRALKKGNIQRIAELDLSSLPRLEIARDFFMFSFYTRGMSSIDMLYLQHSDIVDGVLYYKRHKTQQQMQVTITEPLQSLLTKYDTDQIFALPFINLKKKESLREQYKAAYVQINRDLKKVAKLAGIHTTLTTYVARHSWASVAKDGGAPIAVISEGLGHTSEKTTAIYLSNFDKSVVDDINQMVVML